MNNDKDPQSEEKTTQNESIEPAKPIETELSGNALLAFICGILAVSFGAIFKLLLAPAALYFAYKAHVEYKAQPKKIKTYGLDLIGGLLGLIILIAFIYTLIK